MGWFFGDASEEDLDNLGSRSRDWDFQPVPKRMQRPSRGFEVSNMSRKDWKRAIQQDGSGGILSLPMALLAYGVGGSLAAIGLRLWG